VIDFSTIVKAYDVRGTYPDQINEEAVAALIRGYVVHVKPKKVALGRDVRESGPQLFKAAADAFEAAGVDVVDIGQISTDMLYFAVGHYGLDGGVAITASHNPREYNGMKFVGRDAIAISGDTGLKEIGELATRNLPLATSNKKGMITQKNILEDYLNHIRSFGKLDKLPALTVVANGNFGMAGTVVKKLLEGTPIKLVLINGEPDGSFPKGRPDPLIPSNREEVIARVKSEHADFGVAWDADADRCFFYDEAGTPIEGYYTTAFLAQILLRGHSGETIIHDPRLTWVVQEVVQEAGGTPFEYKTGHGFIKDKMRQIDALFAGEMSGHYYFRDNFYADNGMIPFVLVLSELAHTGKKISELYAPLVERAAISGEINFTLENAHAVIVELKDLYKALPQKEIDGLSVEHTRWRFNVRTSNTEPLLRLNVEARTQADMEHVRDDLIAFLQKRGAVLKVQ